MLRHWVATAGSVAFGSLVKWPDSPKAALLPIMVEMSKWSFKRFSTFRGWSPSPCRVVSRYVTSRFQPCSWNWTRLTFLQLGWKDKKTGYDSAMIYSPGKFLILNSPSPLFILATWEVGGTKCYNRSFLMCFTNLNQKYIHAKIKLVLLVFVLLVELVQVQHEFFETTTTLRMYSSMKPNSRLVNIIYIFDCAWPVVHYLGLVLHLFRSLVIN